MTNPLATRVTTKRIWRKHFTGRTSGTLAGRDDGHPEPCHIDYNADNTDDLHDMAMSHGTQENERYEHVVERVSSISDDDLAKIIARGKASKKRMDEESQRRRDEDELQRLQKKLEKL